MRAVDGGSNEADPNGPNSRVFWYPVLLVGVVSTEASSWTESNNVDHLFRV
jgi:hypothetical protein